MLIIVLFISNVISASTSCLSTDVASTPRRDCNKCYYTKRHPPEIGCKNYKGEKVSYIVTSHRNVVPGHKSDTPVHSCHVSGPYKISHGSVSSFTNTLGDGKYTGKYDKLNTLWSDVTFTSQNKMAYQKLVVCNVGIKEAVAATEIACLITAPAAGVGLGICVGGVAAAGYVGGDICNAIVDWRSKKTCGVTIY